MKHNEVKPIFPVGAILIERDGNRLFRVMGPKDYENWHRDYSKRSVRYAAMSPEEFGQELHREGTRECLSCSREETHFEYVNLAVVDSLGVETGKYASHICELKLKLSKKHYDEEMAALYGRRK